jgi:hypothetical protein
MVVAVQRLVSVILETPHCASGVSFYLITTMAWVSFEARASKRVGYQYDPGRAVQQPFKLNRFITFLQVSCNFKVTLVQDARIPGIRGRQRMLSRTTSGDKFWRADWHTTVLVLNGDFKLNL